MFKKDKEYYIIETIALACYSVGLILACATKYISFIFLALAVYPISNFVLNKHK